MVTNTILVVGKDPADDKYGFDAVPNTTYGTLIPDRMGTELVDSLIVDESAGSVVLTIEGGANVLGDEAHMTLATGETIDLTGVAGVYTAGTTSTAYTDVIVANLNGVQNAFIGGMSSFSSAETTDATTIEVTLDQAVSASMPVLADWSVVSNSVANPVTAVVISGTTVTLTVTNDILTTEVVTVSHTRDNYINTMTTESVTNNEV